MHPDLVYIDPRFYSMAASAPTEIHASSLNSPLAASATATALTRAELVWITNLDQSHAAVKEHFNGLRGLAETFRSIDTTLSAECDKLW